MWVFEALFYYMLSGMFLAIAFGVLDARMPDRFMGKEKKPMEFAHYAGLVAWGPALLVTFFAAFLLVGASLPYAWFARWLVKVTTKKATVHVSRPVQLVRDDDDQWRNPN